MNRVDAAAKHLRETMQAGKKLTPWDVTPKATKKKWLALAEGTLLAAGSLSTPIAAWGGEATDIISGINADLGLLLMAVEAGDPKAELKIRVTDVGRAMVRLRAALSTAGEPVAWQRRLTLEDDSNLGDWKECTKEQADYAMEHGHPEGFSELKAEVRALVVASPPSDTEEKAP